MIFSQSAPLPDLPARFDFLFPSLGPLPHRIRLTTNQQPSLTSILPVLTCEPVTRSNLKGDSAEMVTSRKWFAHTQKQLMKRVRLTIYVLLPEHD